MSSLRGTEHAFNFYFVVCRELVMIVNIPVQERNATCRTIASAGSSTRQYLSPIKNRRCCLSRCQHSNGCYDVMTSMHALYTRVQLEAWLLSKLIIYKLI